jgi:hypothetical protein
MDTYDQIIAAKKHARVMTCHREHKASWTVLQRHGNASAFNGYRWQDSAYSSIRCGQYGRVWRTKGAYADTLPDATT